MPIPAKCWVPSVEHRIDCSQGPNDQANPPKAGMQQNDQTTTACYFFTDFSHTIKAPKYLDSFWAEAQGQQSI